MKAMLRTMGMIGAMLMMSGNSGTYPLHYLSDVPVPNTRLPRPYDRRSGFKRGPGTSQRKRRKLGRQTPAGKYNK